MPVAAGVAWASKYVLKEDKITALFIGDAATSNAQFAEGINAAALHKVPLLIVIEDNHLAGNITSDYYFPAGTSIGDRLAAYGVTSQSIDGNKLDHVIGAATRAVERVRIESKPFALICDTTRLLMHKIGQGDIRTPDQIAELAKRDPIPYVEQSLSLPVKQIVVIKDEAEKIVEEAIAKAHAAPWPEPDAILLGD